MFLVRLGKRVAFPLAQIGVTLGGKRFEFRRETRNVFGQTLLQVFRITDIFIDRIHYSSN